MTKKRRIPALLLAAALCAGLLAGCAAQAGPQSAAEQAPSAGETATPQEEPEAAGPELEPVTITVWITSSQDTEFNTYLDEKFAERYPHITLNKVVKEGDPSNEFYQAVAVGNAPDVVFPSYTMMDKYMKAGILEPLNRYVEQWEEWEHFTPEYADMITVNGSLYGIPSEIAPMMFAYNKALFAGAGYDAPPATWEEALEMAEKITDPANQVYGYGTLTSQWTEWFFQYYVWQAGGDLTLQNADDTITLTFDDDAVIAAAEYYQQLRRQGVLPSDLTIDFNGLIEMFAQGKIGMMPFAGDWVTNVARQGMDLDDLGLCVPPAGPSGESATAITGVCYAMNAASDDAVKDAVWEYISFHLSREIKVELMENKKSLGAANPTIIPRDDIDVVAIYELPAEYEAVLEGVKSIGRDEFYGKADFGAYVDRAVQEVLVNPNSDPLTEFTAAQQLAEAELLEQYNEEILNS